MPDDTTTKATEDSELRAMLALIKYLTPLDHAARTRVIAYGQARFVNQDPIEFDPEGFSNFVKALSEASRQMGDLAPVDIVKAALEIQRIRDEQEEAA